MKEALPGMKHFEEAKYDTKRLCLFIYLKGTTINILNTTWDWWRQSISIIKAATKETLPLEPPIGVLSEEQSTKSKNQGPQTYLHCHNLSSRRVCLHSGIHRQWKNMANMKIWFRKNLVRSGGNTRTSWERRSLTKPNFFSGQKNNAVYWSIEEVTSPSRSISTLNSERGISDRLAITQRTRTL